MKRVQIGWLLGATLGFVLPLEAQYLAPRQYLKRLPSTQPSAPAAPATPTLPPGPSVTPPPTATAVPTAADVDKAAAEKQAATKRVIEFQRKRAAGGSASAQYTVGLRYVQGDGVEKNLAEGCKWLRAAAKQDHVWARKKLEELEKELGPLPPDPVAKPQADRASGPQPTPTPSVPVESPVTPPER